MFLLVLDIARGLATGHWQGIEIWVLILFAEYAATIRTIPPTETKRSQSLSRQATSKSKS